MCTLRNFPNIIEHCIEWGREHFNALFCDRATNAKSYLKDSEGFMKHSIANNTSAGTREQLKQIADLVIIAKSKDFKNCV
jgi:ubiquitin-activating enzyme E1